MTDHAIASDKFTMDHDVSLPQGQALAIHLGIGTPEGASRIGRLSTAADGTRAFSQEHMTGKDGATVTGIGDDQKHTFRLLCRMERVELYVDDLLMQDESAVGSS